ncbi:outer membrane protein [Devosia sp.]|uniref:outer membrane protein n=1 Tax=Devosia sp. TaxID=1871048 RepID=UPI003BA8D2B5
MNKFALAVLSVALLTGTASAADLIIDAPAPEAMAPMSTDSAMYFSIFGGVNLLDSIDYDSTGGGGTSGELNFDSGYSIDAALGVNLGGGLSLEGQLGYLNADLTDGTYGGTPFGAEGSASAVYAMANAWYGIDLGGITPFIGAGVGIANLTLDSQYDAPFNNASFEDSGVTYAAQVGAGVSLNVTDNMALTARYRYLMTGDVDFTDGDGDTVTGHLATNIVDVGLKISF